MRPALALKSGSRGKTQPRCRHGRMASSCSQRHTVLSFDAGAAHFARHVGDAHARQRQSQIGRQLTGQRLDLNDQLRGGGGGGGGSPGASGPGALVESWQAFVEEPLPPLADDLAPRVEPRGDLVVAQSLRGQEDHPGALNLEIAKGLFLGMIVPRDAPGAALSEVVPGCQNTFLQLHRSAFGLPRIRLDRASRWGPTLGVSGC